MNSFIIYILEVSICLALFYSVYVVFKGDTFYYLKRIYLVITVLISLIIPQVSSPNLPVDIEQIIVVEPTQDLSNVTFRDTFEKVVFGQIPENMLVSQNKFFLSFISLLGIIYILGVLYFLYRFLRNLVHIYHLYKYNKKEEYLNYRVILSPNEYPTFSFFNCIFLNNKNLTDEDRDDVILHELIHIKQKHSFDIVFIEVCRMFFWFNPIIWLYKSSIVKVHECLADQFFLENKPENIIDYQSLLLKQYLSKIHIELAHPFNYSLIKYRIKMMTKNKSKWWAKFKIIFALPIIVIGLVAFSNADINLTDKLGNNGEEMETEPEGMVFIPQGSFTMKRSDGQQTKEYYITVEPFWMKETEVSIKEYNEYLESLKRDTTLEVYNAALPDYSKAPLKKYFTSKKYEDYPIVGITLPQARKYCIWKTNSENIKLIIEGNVLIQDYRMPMEVEWIYASFGGMNPYEIIKPEILPLTKTGSGKPNDFGLYNMFDNVSEWTANILNPSIRFTRNQNGGGLPIIQKRDISDSTSDWYNVDIEPKQFINYLDSLNMQTGQTIVKGNSYKDLAIDENQILESSLAYDYVGFRYVLSYLGRRNQ